MPLSGSESRLLNHRVGHDIILYTIKVGLTAPVVIEPLIFYGSITLIAL